MDLDIYFWSGTCTKAGMAEVGMHRRGTQHLQMGVITYFWGGDMHQGWDVSGRESADAGTLCLVLKLVAL
jgi:hypothetical protein